MSKSFLSQRVEETRLWISLQDLVKRSCFDSCHQSWCLSTNPDPMEEEGCSSVNLQDRKSTSYLDSNFASCVFLNQVCFHVKISADDIQGKCICFPHGILGFVDEDEIQLEKLVGEWCVIGSPFYCSQAKSRMGIYCKRLCLASHPDYITNRLQAYDQACLVQKANFMRTTNQAVCTK